MRQVPKGRVTTYGVIARLIPPPPNVDPEPYVRLGARWVGNAMRQCPEDVPWQRVINARGKISPRPGALQQRVLLELEGVVFDADARVDLQVYAWPEAPRAPQLSMF